MVWFHSGVSILNIAIGMERTVKFAYASQGGVVSLGCTFIQQARPRLQGLGITRTGKFTFQAAYASQGGVVSLGRTFIKQGHCKTLELKGQGSLLFKRHMLHRVVWFHLGVPLLNKAIARPWN